MPFELLCIYSQGLSKGERVCRVTGECEAKWAENLPTGCPPQEAIDSSGEEFYRFVRSDPPTARDFWSQHKLGIPALKKTSECRRKALSMRPDLETARHMLKLPSRKGGKRKIARVLLRPDAGCFRVTNEQTRHIAMWNCAAAGLPQNSTVIK